jgi:hypothetical protein
MNREHRQLLRTTLKILSKKLDQVFLHKVCLNTAKTQHEFLFRLILLFAFFILTLHNI